MADKKDQHYVPKMLMKRFADTNHKFSYVVRKGKKLEYYFEKPYDNQCQYDYYYGRDKEWENRLEKVETACSVIFDKITTNRSYYPTPDEISLIKVFFTTQHSRTPRFIDHEKQSCRRVFLEYVRGSIYKDGYTQLSQQEIDYLDSINDEKYDKSAKDAVRSFCFDAKYISDLELLIIHFDCHQKLILSDDPVIVLNSFVHSAGLLDIGIIMILPIGCDTMLVLRDPVFFKKCDKIIYSSRDTAVNSINRLETITFDKYLMFKPFESKTYIEHLILTTDAERKGFFNSGKGGVFPGPKSSLIVNHHPTLKPNYPYVFSSIKKEYRAFCFFDCQSYRIKNDKYIDRLETLLPKVSSIPGSHIDVKKIPKYKEFILNYWAQHELFETIKIDLDAEFGELNQNKV